MNQNITRDRIEEIMQGIAVPGMDEGSIDGWQDGVLEWSERWMPNIIHAYQCNGLWQHNDELTNMVRFGTCRFIGAAADQLIPSGEQRPEVQQLLDALHEAYDPVSVSWQYFEKALPYILYGSNDWDEAALCVTMQDAGYYSVDLRYEIEEEAPDEISDYPYWRVTIFIGAGWADVYAIHAEVGIGGDGNEEEFIKLLRAILPDYML